MCEKCGISLPDNAVHCYLCGAVPVEKDLYNGLHKTENDLDVNISNMNPTSERNNSSINKMK